MRTTTPYRSSTSLAFSRDGLLNPDAIDFYRAKRIDTLAIVSDGTEEAYQHIRSFNFSNIVQSTANLAIVRLPLWDMRVVAPDGDLSEPNYVYSDANKHDWFCSRICAPLCHINLLDTSSPSGTKVQLQEQQIEQMCDMSLRFWTMLKAAEDRLAFPAMAIDAMIRWTRVLAPEHIDIPVLRKETGLTTLEYSLLTDLLSVEVAGELFTVKLSVLNAFYKNHILPFFNKYQGRRWQMEVTILGISDPSQPHQRMSYGDFGRVLDQMRGIVKSRRIDSTMPMTAEDTLAYAKKVKIDGESCLYGRHGQTIGDFLNLAKPIATRPAEGADLPGGSNDTHAEHADTLVAA